MAFFVYRSNQLERLIEPLVRAIASPLRSPLEPEVFVVPGPAVGRWLALELSRRTGIVTNVTFLSLAEAMDRILATEDAPTTNAIEPFSLDWLVWALFQHLPALYGHPHCHELRRLVGPTLDEPNVWRTATFLAPSLAACPLYRPDVVARWEQGEQPEAWPAIVWRYLVTQQGPSRLQRNLRRLRVRSSAAHHARAPERIVLFGLSALAPLLFDLLEHRPTQLDIHGFFLSPSQEHWADVRKHAPAKQIALPFDEGPTLLPSLGRVGQNDHFFLEERTRYLERNNLYVDPPATTVLGLLQSDLLHVRKRSPHGAETAAVTWPVDDESLTVHACHTALHEVEVLYENVLHLLARDPSLQADDILVLAPDLGLYAPLIHAMFGQPRSENRWLRYRILEDTTQPTNPVEASLLAVFRSLEGRVTAHSLLGLLEREPVRRRFELDEVDLPDLHRWVAETNVRWGVDGTDRSEWNVPAVHETTWRFGLDRLVLGCLMPDSDGLFQTTSPYAIWGTKNTEVLGRFCTFCETMFEFRRTLRKLHRPRQWREIFHHGMETLVFEEEYDENRTFMNLRVRLDHLVQCAQAAECEQEISLRTLLDWLEHDHQRQACSQPLFTGGISFATLREGQILPHRMIALLGMNDGAFPRPSTEQLFVPLSLEPRRGDVNTRDRENYLFLEAILATRSHLLITYVGSSNRDRTRVAPAKPVTELLQMMDESFLENPLLPPEHTSTDRFITWHSAPSMVREDSPVPPGNLPAATPFFSRRLPRSAPFERIEIEQFFRFFSHPIRTLLQQTLGMHIPRSHETEVTREPLLLSGSETHQMGSILLDRLLSDADLTTPEAYFRSQGALPAGPVGRCIFDAISLPTTRLAEALRRQTFLPPREVSIKLGSVELVGSLRHMTTNGVLHFRYGAIRAQDKLRAWIEHLMWLQAAGSSEAGQTHVVGFDTNHHLRQITFGAVEDSAALLGDLMELYQIGLEAPLCLFAEASLAYAEATKNGKEDPREKAAQTFASTVMQRWGVEGDTFDPYVRLVLGGKNPFDADFSLFSDESWCDVPRPADIAQRVFSPLLHFTEKRTANDV